MSSFGECGPFGYKGAVINLVVCSTGFGLALFASMTDDVNAAQPAIVFSGLLVIVTAVLVWTPVSGAQRE